MGFPLPSTLRRTAKNAYWSRIHSGVAFEFLCIYILTMRKKLLQFQKKMNYTLHHVDLDGRKKNQSALIWNTSVIEHCFVYSLSIKSRRFPKKIAKSQIGKKVHVNK